MKGNRSFKPYKKVGPRFVVFMYVSVIAFSLIYFILGYYLFDSQLKFYDYLIFTSILAIVVVGSYQLYFWTEYNNTQFKAKCFKIPLDDYIPHMPSFIWIYNLSYYIIIGLVIVSITSLEQGLHYIFGGLVLLSVHCVIFYFFPSVVPEGWRKYKTKSKSAKFLKFVQNIDSGRNCKPSMHMSVAMYVSLLLLPILSYYSFIFVFLIGASCLLVKQHVILDLSPGVLLGWLVYVLVL